MQARVIAACFSLSAFIAVVVIGLYVNNPALTVLVRAIVVGIVAFVVGSIIGHVAQGMVEGYVDRYKSENPMPEAPRAVGEDESQSDSQTTDGKSIIASNG